MFYKYLKIIYITGLACWLHSIFSLFRIYCYHLKIKKRPENEQALLHNQYSLIERNIWYFTAWPFLLITFITGIWLLSQPGIYKEGWLHLKLVLMAGLFIHHLHCGLIRKKFADQTYSKSAISLNILKITTFFFVVIIISIAFLKDLYSELWGLTILSILGVILLSGLIILFRKTFLKKSDQLNSKSSAKTD
ncbi:MAG: hypothetical protein GY730_02910 [bacterium]|nr:hypothetical protein [bacterium]